MTAQDLKNSILQYAIQGKLVPQDPKDEPASELLKRIHAERERLVKEGKLKKGKPLPPITSEEIPFEIPQSWMWVRLESIVLIEMGQSPAGESVSKSSSGLEFHQGKFFFGNKYLKSSDQTTISPSKVVGPNTILLCVRAPVGKVNITLREICIGRGLCGINPIVDIDIDYLYYLLVIFEGIFVKQATGTTFVAITAETVRKQIIPLPPLAEQRRIVAKIEELMPLVEAYGKAEERLTVLNEEFPEKLRKSILQQAVQGKLTQRDPKDEPASELLKRIRAEKAKLIAEGKIRKEKPLPPISEEEIPFEIPETWEWVRVCQVCNAIVDCPHSTPHYRNENTGFCGIDTNCITETGLISHFRYVDEATYNKRIERLKPQKGDIVFSREGTIGLTCILPDGNICLGQRVMLFRLSSIVSSAFIIFMLSEQGFRERLLHKGIGAKHVNVSDITKALIPLPPLAEQQRIVERVEELLSSCDNLKQTGVPSSAKEKADA